uniref:Uncharacterized protein n=1 Tax=Glossina brevipalpis TaxID=37001 RepID=A0A1A9WIJ6_9MUSC
MKSYQYFYLIFFTSPRIKIEQQNNLLKSADASSDDEGWLYTSASTPAAQQQQKHSATTANDCLNSIHSRGSVINHNSSEITDGIQSSAVSSSTATAPAIAQTAVVISSSKVSAILGDDSDKENKEILSSSANLTKIHLALNTHNTTFSACTTSVIESSSSSSVASSSSSSNNSSVASSNDMLTEATTTSTSSKTNATQILNTFVTQRNEKMEGSYFNNNTSTSIENNIENCHSNNSNNNTASYKTVAQFVITNQKRNEHKHNYTNSSTITKTSLAANSHKSQRYETSTQLVHQHPLPTSQVTAATSSLSSAASSTTASVLATTYVDVTNGSLEKFS